MGRQLGVRLSDDLDGVVKRVKDALHMKSDSDVVTTFLSVVRERPIDELKEFLYGASRFPVRVSVPVLGCIPAGLPQEVLENPDNTVDELEDVLPVRAGDVFLKVKGDSMIGVGIFTGDLVLIRPGASYNNGDICAVLVNDERCATLKRYYQEPGSESITLKAENPAHKDVRTKVGKCEVVGPMIGLVRSSQ